MEKPVPSSKVSKDKYTSLIALYETSGLTLKSFCKQHRLVYSTFQYWRRKSVTAQTVSPAFVEVSFLKKENKYPSSTQILFPSGATIKLDFGTDLSLIRSLLF